MTKKRTHIFSWIVLSTIVIAACTTTSSTGPTSMVGTLHGRVRCLSDDVPNNPDASGVKVAIDGTSFSALTDSGGNWTITNLPSGIYTITFSKAGFGTMKIFGNQFVGGGELYLNGGGQYSMFAIPKWTVTDLAARDTFSVYQHIETRNSRDTLIVDSTVPYLVLFGHVSSAGPISYYGRQIKLYAAVGNSVVYDPATSDLLADVSTQQYNIRDTLLFSYKLMRDSPFPPGCNISIVGYPYPYGDGGYWDPRIPKSIYTAFGAPSTVLHVTIP